MADRPPQGRKRDHAGRFLRRAAAGGPGREPGGHWPHGGVRNWGFPAPANPLFTSPIIIAGGGRAQAMGSTTEKGDRGQEGGAPFALPGQREPAGGACHFFNAGQPLPVEMERMPLRGWGRERPWGDPFPAGPWRSRAGGAAPQGWGTPAEARAYAAGEEAAAEIRWGRMSTGAVLIRFQLALGRIKDTVSSPLSALNWVMQHACALDVAALADDPMGAISGMYGWWQGRFESILGLVLPRALVYIFKKIFPNLVRGAAAETPAEKAAVKLVGSPRLLETLCHVQDFAKRALSMRTEPVHEISTFPVEGLVPSDHLSIYERSVDMGEDAAKRYSDSMYGITVTASASENARVCAPRSPPAGRRGRTPASPRAGLPSIKASRTLVAISVFLIVRWILSLARIADMHVTQELVAHALQLMPDLPRLLAG